MILTLRVSNCYIDCLDGDLPPVALEEDRALSHCIISVSNSI